jgi:hypothetical protein
MSFTPNFILQTDSYKQYHWTMRIHNTTRTYPGDPGTFQMQTSKRPWTTCGRTSNTRS